MSSGSGIGLLFEPLGRRIEAVVGDIVEHGGVATNLVSILRSWVGL
jgi:hypothetical protein